MHNIELEEILEEHRGGKISVEVTCSMETIADLRKIYTPGVAEVCRIIENDPSRADDLTMIGNTVCIATNGTAVLGLGDIGVKAAMPVMEGKSVILNKMSGVACMPILIDSRDADHFVEVLSAVSCGFSAVMLEDISAPLCFEIEKKMLERVNMPVFHDDQHGTAIISGAALLNALELNGKKIDQLKIVVNGAGAAAVSCIRLYISLGADPRKVIMLDSKGVLNTRRTDLNEIKKQFVAETDANILSEVMVRADVFLGLSVGNTVSKEMIQSMAENPIVFAMANPTPEISYDDAVAARGDVIMATGRSDYPNQINNVLGFPFIFRGALDVRASKINEEMKIAAVHALAKLTKEPVPQYVVDAYDVDKLIFGKEYLIPKPIDKRLITWIAPAVARAAIESGVARNPVTDWESYLHGLDKRLGYDNQLLWNIRDKARKNPKRLVFADATNCMVLRAVQSVINEGFAHPILLGNKNIIRKIQEDNSIDLGDILIIDPRSAEEETRRKKFAELYYEKRKRKGVNMEEAIDFMYNPNYFGMMMVKTGEADAFISGYRTKYSETIRPALQIFGVSKGQKHIAGMYILLTKKGPFFFADTTVNIQPDAQTLADIAVLVACEVQKFNIEPRIAMLSYSNFGAIKETSPQQVRDAVAYLHQNYPDLIVDGEIQANFAINKKLRTNKFPFSKLQDKDINTLIFPDLNSGNIAYKLMKEIGNAEVIGPILIGIPKPIHILQMECSEQEIIDMAAIAVVDAQYLEETTSEERDCDKKRR